MSEPPDDDYPVQLTSREAIERHTAMIQEFDEEALHHYRLRAKDDGMCWYGATIATCRDAPVDAAVFRFLARTMK